MTLTRLVVIPAFNEEASLGDVLCSIRDLAAEFEPLVVDDGSTDRTSEVAQDHGALLVRHPYNLGYGAALQTGYKYALRRGASVATQMDADGQHDPGYLEQLVRPIESGQADLVVGSRFLDDSGYRMTFLQALGRKTFRLIAARLGLEISDPTSGYQALSARVLEFYSRAFFPVDYPDVNVLLSAHLGGFRVVEIPVVMSHGSRPSLLHGGLRDLYYVYKMALSIWAAPVNARTGPTSSPTE